MTHASVADSPLAVDPGLIRLSVGLETLDDLLADLTATLDRADKRPNRSARQIAEQVVDTTHLRPISRCGLPGVGAKSAVMGLHPLLPGEMLLTD